MTAGPRPGLRWRTRSRGQAGRSASWVEAANASGLCSAAAGSAISRTLSNQAKETTLVDAGTQAPDFELPDRDGRPVRLSELRGRKVVPYFYPNADAPGH